MVTPSGDPNELNFELDNFKSLNKSNHELNYSECGNKNKCEENDLVQDYQSHPSHAKKSATDEKK